MFRFFIGIYVLSITTGHTQSRFINVLPDRITLHNVLRTWEAAQGQCANEGGVLASPINETIYNSMKSLIDVKNRTFYIGARVTHSPGQFVSVEGVPLENMTVAMINMSPELDPLGGDCVAMNSDSMRVVPCWTRLPYMCLTSENTSPAMEKNTSTTESTSPRKERTNCGPDESYKYNASQNTCYKIHSLKKNWEQAEKTCVGEGGHLVVINNESEARTVMEMVKDSNWSATWTGLHYRAAEDNWFSVNGTRVEDLYHTWYDNRKPDNQVCIQFHDNILGWMNCHGENFFICERNSI